jgi:hypothetical protein
MQGKPAVQATVAHSHTHSILTNYIWQTRHIESSAISLEYNYTSLATLNYHIALLRTLKPRTEPGSFILVYRPLLIV